MKTRTGCASGCMIWMPHNIQSHTHHIVNGSFFLADFLPFLFLFLTVSLPLPLYVKPDCPSDGVMKLLYQRHVPPHVCHPLTPPWLDTSTLFWSSYTAQLKDTIWSYCSLCLGLVYRTAHSCSEPAHCKILITCHCGLIMLHVVLFSTKWPWDSFSLKAQPKWEILCRAFHCFTTIPYQAQRPYEVAPWTNTPPLRSLMSMNGCETKAFLGTVKISLVTINCIAWAFCSYSPPVPSYDVGGTERGVRFSRSILNGVAARAVTAPVDEERPRRENIACLSPSPKPYSSC